jgi:IclR family transcriptional regulator, KDG regulon repressor
MPQQADLVIRTLDVLDCFTPGEPEWGVTELATTLGMTKSRVHRIVQTLESKNYLRQNQLSRRYRLGSRCVEIGASAARALDRTRVIHDELGRLAAEVGATVTLRARHASEIIFIASVESPAPVRVVVEHPSRHPIYCGAAGMAICASLSSEELTLIVPSNLTRWTPKSYATLRDLRKKLDDVRATGFAVSDEQVQLGVRSIGAVVKDVNGKVIGAVAAGFPKSELSEKDYRRVGRKVVDFARSLSALITHLSSLGIVVGDGYLNAVEGSPTGNLKSK